MRKSPDWYASWDKANLEQDRPGLNCDFDRSGSRAPHCPRASQKTEMPLSAPLTQEDSEFVKKAWREAIEVRRSFRL
jgi:hypothetical protein